MTGTQAAELRMKWKPRVDPLSYEHLNLELEWGDNGYLMGNYNGIVCGKAAAKNKHDRIHNPLSRSQCRRIDGLLCFGKCLKILGRLAS